MRGRDESRNHERNADDHGCDRFRKRGEEALGPRRTSWKTLDGSPTHVIAASARTLDPRGVVERLRNVDDRRRGAYRRDQDGGSEAATAYTVRAVENARSRDGWSVASAIVFAAVSTLPWMKRTYAVSERSNPYVPNSDSVRFRART